MQKKNCAHYWNIDRSHRGYFLFSAGITTLSLAWCGWWSGAELAHWSLNESPNTYSGEVNQEHSFSRTTAPVSIQSPPLSRLCSTLFTLRHEMQTQSSDKNYVRGTDEGGDQNADAIAAFLPGIKMWTFLYSATVQLLVLKPRVCSLISNSRSRVQLRS